MHISEHLNDESRPTHSGSNTQGTNHLWAIVNALEQTQLAVVISDAQSVIQYVNSGYTRMTGYTSDEVVGRSISEFSKHSAEDRKDIHNTLASGGAWRDEFPIIRKDGSTVWIYNVVSPILDENGVITNYVDIGEDVSAVIHADEGLRRREDRYRILVEKAQDLVYTTDSKGYFTYVNPRCLDLTGYTQEELVGKHFTFGVHPDWRERVEKFYVAQYRSRTPETIYEFPGVTKSGHIKWVEQTVVLVTHEDQVTGFQAIVRDITRRKQAEAEAQALVRENAVIAEITRIISSSLDIGEVYDAFASEVNKLINFDRMVINLIDHDKGVYTVAYGSGTVPSGRELGVELALEGSFTRLVSQRKSSVIVDSDDVRRQGGDLYSANATILESGIKTSMGVPLISMGEVIGVMILDSFTSNAYTQHHRDLGELLARNIVGVIVNAQMHSQIQREAEERADVRGRMATIGRIISSSLDINDVYESFIEQVNGLIPSDRIVVLTLDDDQRLAKTAYVWGTDLTDFQPGDTQPVHNTAIQDLIDTRKGVLRVDEPMERVKNPTPSRIAGLAQGLRSLIAAPLISGDKVIGGLILRSKTPSAYAQRHLELAELIAAQIAGAIANAQMHLQIQREAEERAALAEIGRIIDSSIDIQDVYQRFTEVVNRLIPSDRIAIALSNSQGDAVINTYVWGTEIEGLGIGGVTPAKGTAIETMFETRRGVVVGVESPDEFIAQFPEQAASIAVGLRSMILAPMASDDKIIGTLLLRSKSPNAYDVRDMELAERIAAQISGAVANAQLHADVQKQALERQVLNEIGRIISSTLDVEEVYGAFANRVRMLLPFDKLNINIVDEESGNFKRVHTAGVFDLETPGTVITPTRGTFLHEVVSRKQTVLFCSDSRHEIEQRFPVLVKAFDLGYRSFIGVPLISSDQVVGTLYFNSKSSGVYTETEVSLATRIGLQIAGAIANSFMFAAQQRAERMLEQINEELESKVDARTRELSETNDDLQSSQEQLRALAARMEMIREEERTHISHEIHDEIGQALTGLKFDISWIDRKMRGVKDAGLRDAVSQRISSIFADIDRNIELVRNLSTRLRPAALDNFGLSAAIESEVQEFQERTGILCEVNTPDAEIDIGKDAALGVFRILQEAMTNAARHAAPTSITVDLEQDSRQIVLRVRDDGKGMEDISDMSSLGLLGMKERARLMGGDLVIESALNRGTTVSLRAPIQGQAIQHKG